MPELPEVETTKKSLDPLLNSKVQNVDVFQSKLRWPVPADIVTLKDHTLIDVKRRAKYLILDFKYPTRDDIKSIIIHLGMSGSLQQLPLQTKKRKHDHLIFKFHNGNSKQSFQLHYHDPRRFGAVLWFADYHEKLFNHLGAEPLDSEFSAHYLFDKINRVQDNKLKIKTNKPLLKPITRPIKSVIMDQQFVVGVGNIYATESLFLSGLHPSLPANKLELEQLECLVQHIKSVLHRAIQKGGSTLRDFTVANGTTGYFQQTLLVYGKLKEDCPRCATTIDKVTINGRASTFCPKCQPLN